MIVCESAMNVMTTQHGFTLHNYKLNHKVLATITTLDQTLHTFQVTMMSDNKTCWIILRRKITSFVSGIIPKKFYSNQFLLQGDMRQIRHDDVTLLTLIYPWNCYDSWCDSVAYPPWLVSKEPLVGEWAVSGLKSEQDVMIFLPPSVIFHSSFSSFPGGRGTWGVYRVKSLIKCLCLELL